MLRRYINKQFMGKCKVCKKDSICDLEFCESCIEDLSQDSCDTVPSKKKIIEKRQANKKTKKIKAKKEQNKMKEQEYSNYQQGKQQVDLKTICDEFYLDMHCLTKKQIDYFRYIMTDKSLQKSEMIFLAQTVSFIGSNSKYVQSSLIQLMKRLLIQQKEIMEILFHIENSSVITSFINGKNLPSLFMVDELNDKASQNLNVILNIGCNLKKGRSLSKSGHSYLILKPDVRKRCFLNIYNQKQHKSSVSITSYPEDLLNNLKDEQIKRIIRGYQELEDCQNDENGYCAEAFILGSVSMSRNVKKIVLSPDEIRPGYEEHLQKMKSKYGIEYQILGMDH